MIKLAIKHWSLFDNKSHIKRFIKEVRKIEKENECFYIMQDGNVLLQDCEIERLIEYTRKIDTNHEALAMALYNLTVRNDINPNIMINDIEDFKKKINK